MIPLISESNPPPAAPAIPNLPELKARQKATWESGDFGQIARSIENFAADFMARQPLARGSRVLDVACGTGNLAIIAARHGCLVSGMDIAANLLAQAWERTATAGLSIDFVEADAEALPYADETFDLTVSMFGVMFAPRPAVALAELWRVTKPGGRIALANWTPEGFLGKMFGVFKAHLPPPPAGVPSPMAWGDENAVAGRLAAGFTDVRLTRHIGVMRYPFPPAETVEFFREYYGPTRRAFESLSPASQAALRRDLVDLQTRHNSAPTPDTTEVAAEYLEVVAIRAGGRSRTRPIDALSDFRAPPWGIAGPLSMSGTAPPVRCNGEPQRPNPMTSTDTNTVRLHRVLRSTPERLYRAFLDPDAMAKWLPPHGFTGKVHHMDATVGGSYQMSFTNFSTGSSHSFGGTYLELLPGERIRHTDKFDDPNLPGEMVTTITLRPVFCGTELNITQEGIPAMIPAEACHLGWQESLTLLAQLVEAEIPDQP